MVKPMTLIRGLVLQKKKEMVYHFLTSKAEKFIPLVFPTFGVMQPMYLTQME
jgi:hypothetical protein